MSVCRPQPFDPPPVKQRDLLRLLSAHPFPFFDCGSLRFLSVQAFFYLCKLSFLFRFDITAPQRKFLSVRLPEDHPAADQLRQTALVFVKTLIAIKGPQNRVRLRGAHLRPHRPLRGCRRLPVNAFPCGRALFQSAGNSRSSFPTISGIRTDTLSM